MDTNYDILSYAMDKNTDALKSAVDTIMTAKASDQLQGMKDDYAAGMFGAITGTQEITDQETTPEPTEVTTDENV